jgi:hypothetical protein
MSDGAENELAQNKPEYEVPNVNNEREVELTNVTFNERAVLRRGAHPCVFCKGGIPDGALTLP